jgi:DNA adenine methylase
LTFGDSLVAGFIKSPLNYIGGKYKVLPQIFPLFPREINCFVDLFTGGANVGVNANSKKIVLNDNLIYLIDMFRALATTPEEKVLDYIDKMVAKFGLSMTNTDGYIKLREQYNKTKEPLDLLILTFFSFNHQIRFNSDHKFNTPFGKNRSRYNANIKKNLIDFMKALHSKNIIFTKLDFDKFDFSQLGRNDFVYCDPPYLITVGTYNDGKRGFTGWSGEQEQKLLSVLDSLNDQKIKFALSNVLTHKDRRNDLLNNWVKNNHYTVHNINKDYANSNYQTSSRNGILTQEVLITNY